MPFGRPDYHKSLEHLHVGCEKNHAYFIPFADKESALSGVRDESPYFKTLIGEWNFKFFPSVTEIDDPYAVIFADDTFGPVEKSRIMSSLTLGYFAKFEPGFMKLYPVVKESTSNIMHVVNGFTNTSKKNNQPYSLTDSCLDSDTIV